MIKLSMELSNLILKQGMLSNESFVFVGGNVVANRAGMGPRCFLKSELHWRQGALPKV